jgi:hypothetical protein
MLTARTTLTSLSQGGPPVVWIPDMDEEESELFGLWLVECGRKSHELRDAFTIGDHGVPMLTRLLRRERPEWAFKRRNQMHRRLQDIMNRSMWLARCETGGSA